MNQCAAAEGFRSNFVTNMSNAASRTQKQASLHTETQTNMQTQVHVHSITEYRPPYCCLPVLPPPGWEPQADWPFAPSGWCSE